MRTLLCFLPLMVTAAEVDPAALAVQAKSILDANCLKCHGPEKHKGDLRLDSLEAILKGGEDGKVVVPGAPDDSPLILGIRWQNEDKDKNMPPKKRLADTDIVTLTDWVKAGAPYPKAETKAE